MRTADALAPYRYVPPEPRVIVGGRGALENLPALAQELGVRRAAVITSPSLVRQERVLSRLCDHLGDRWIGTFAEVKPHSPIEVVRSALAAVRDWEADTVVSLGGGSSVDTAKGVVWYFDEQASSPPITHIAVPSTLSGAEFTHDAGITFPEGKRVHRHTRVVPPGVILDPEVAASVPTDFFGKSLLNALAHCLEGLVSIGASPMTDGAYMHAVRLLQRAHSILDRDDGRQLAQAGACLAAIHQVPVGLAHALVHIIGGRFKVPHAMTHAIVGPAVMRFNLPTVAARQRSIAEAFGVATAGLTDEEAAWAAVKAAQEMARNLGVPPGLRDLGVPEDGLVGIAEDVPQDPCFPTNPRRIDSVEESLTALRWAWSGELPEP